MTQSSPFLRIGTRGSPLALWQAHAVQAALAAAHDVAPESIAIEIIRTTGDVIQDPAAGTGGFLIAADRFMRAKTDGYFDGLSPKQQTFQLKSALRGIENVQDTFRLLLMNLHLHQIDPDYLDLADTLSPTGALGQYKNADLILTNPPFGPAGGPPTGCSSPAAVPISAST